MGAKYSCDTMFPHTKLSSLLTEGRTIPWGKANGDFDFWHWWWTEIQAEIGHHCVGNQAFLEGAFPVPENTFSNSTSRRHVRQKQILPKDHIEVGRLIDIHLVHPSSLLRDSTSTLNRLKSRSQKKLSTTQDSPIHSESYDADDYWSRARAAQK